MVLLCLSLRNKCIICTSVFLKIKVPISFTTLASTSIDGQWTPLLDTPRHGFHHLHCVSMGAYRHRNHPRVLVGCHQSKLDVLHPFPTTDSGNYYVLVHGYGLFHQIVRGVCNPWAEQCYHSRVTGVLIVLWAHGSWGPSLIRATAWRRLEVFTEVCQRMGVRKIRTTPLHPERQIYNPIWVWLQLNLDCSFPKNNSPTRWSVGEAFGCCVPSEAVCQGAAGSSASGPLGWRFLQHPQVLSTKRKVGNRGLQPAGFVSVGCSLPVVIRTLLSERTGECWGLCSVVWS